MSSLLVTLLITSIRVSKMTLLHWTDTVLPFSCPQPIKLFSFFPFETFKPVKTCHHQWHTFAIDVTWCLPVRMVLLCLSHRWSRIVLGPMKGCLFRGAQFLVIELRQIKMHDSGQNIAVAVLFLLMAWDQTAQQIRNLLFSLPVQIVVTNQAAGHCGLFCWWPIDNLVQRMISFKAVPHWKG